MIRTTLVVKALATSPVARISLCNWFFHCFVHGWCSGVACFVIYLDLLVYFVAFVVVP
jgi:hypothetical protein